ncbi:MAG: N-glycosylase/DNA lyase [Candidatus Caldarchaeum sp.]
MKKDKLILLHEKFKAEIAKALEGFKQSRNNTEQILEELVFCLCTPQTMAQNALKAVQEIKDQGLFKKPDRAKISHILKKSGVRFHRTKAKRIISMLKTYPAVIERINAGGNQDMLRDFLVETVDGFGMKEASHFLRNIGYENVAIIDRHILRYLKSEGVVKKNIKHLTRKRYLDVEKKFIELALKYGFKPAERDLLVWSASTGRVLK